ncbi:MaoC family dehydratase N-terminal domain-containing protein [Bradyrhizobium sp. LHD-71]|uniref:FAS1-like dehydratase domain-containing protein n=1 Tax=Bradyrhizobium sp. LHD-71 TaxID=3072141 RepID=UPI00281068DF|nr:MaoC family dehydratase N-terminal domain-containing protein [Bradyrhizobium sp. LHD-71]MDQ8732781.1 MaoC family dehydratase N-terminal domain-containing protein [Bradyrhizobium sp. LHD-71]
MSETAKLDLDHLRKWIGKVEEAADVVTARMVQGLRATLFLDPGEPKTGDPAPLTMHWCYMLPIVAAAEIGPDGHPARGGFLPPVPLPRRMWAGGQTVFTDVLRVGDAVTRQSKISNVELKTGSTGSLCFVTVDHTYATPRGVALTETQNIVYRDPPPADGKPPSPPPTAPKAPHSKPLTADPVLLFRYSALTFNGHRIHYDRPYVTGVEGYPGLVVHGPLQAALLLEYAIELRGGVPPKSFIHRGVNPLFDGPLTLNAQPTADGFELWTANPAGAACMKAGASW